MKEQQPERWLSGPVNGIEPLLQPVAHAVLQANREVTDALEDFPSTLLNQHPGGAASVAFHLRHLTGVLDRLFTYARGEQLSQEQLSYLSREAVEDDVEVGQLIDSFHAQVNRSLQQLRRTSASTLLEAREVGRKKIPSNVLGLLFHAAEHTQRHTGQLLVTVKVLRANPVT